MNAIELLGWIWALAAILMVIMWEIQRRTENASLVDVAWTLGVGGSAVLYALLAEGDLTRRVLVAVLAGTWSLRLAWHVFDRVWDKEEDARYQRLRARWSHYTQLKFFFFYQSQALAIVLFSIPFLVVTMTDESLPAWAMVTGILIWLVAVGGEALADRQLEAWRADPANRGRTCRAGLWRYSRHPNYFFEWLHWWAYLPLAVGSPWWWLTLLGPAVMLFTLFKLTGIPHTEQQALASRGEDYRAYQRSTSVFIPWFPKQENER